jgi:hypothetical protein
MNAFASYAAEKATRDTFRDWDNQRSKHAPQKELSPLEKKMREKQRLSRAFRIWRRNETRAVLATEPRLSVFLRYLRTVTVDTGNELLEAVEACDWLLQAPQPVRIFALRMISARCDKINQMLGNDILDDPLPPDSNIYFQARDLLYAGGRA